MSSISEDYIKGIINKVLSNFNFTDFYYSNETFQNVTQNYFGVVLPVSITANDGEKQTTVNLVLKMAPTDERFRVSGAITLMFAREIFVYATLLEHYREIQHDFPIGSQYIMPKCYYLSNEYCKEVIVMQNMCHDTYKPFTEKAFLDYDHISVSLKALANFHALSFILKDKKPAVYEETTNICLPLTEKTNKRFMEILLDRLQRAIEKFAETKYSDLLQELKENCIEYVEAATFATEELCLCHGDIWKENILYKYENTKPVSACLIDYQVTRMCSPAFDILYLITSSVDSDLRRIHFTDLLNIYYDKFSEILRNVGMKSSVVYPRQKFESDLKTVSPACFIIANTAFWLSNGLQQEGHVRSKLVLTTPEEKEAAANKYRKVIKDIIEDYVGYGYLNLI
ncbi:hypothetical protein ACJJTC_011563 [Scirpophaga incertulas]